MLLYIVAAVPAPGVEVHTAEVLLASTCLLLPACFFLACFYLLVASWSAGRVCALDPEQRHPASYHDGARPQRGCQRKDARERDRGDGRPWHCCVCELGFPGVCVCVCVAWRVVPASLPCTTAPPVASSLQRCTRTVYSLCSWIATADGWLLGAGQPAGVCVRWRVFGGNLADHGHYHRGISVLLEAARHPSLPVRFVDGHPPPPYLYPPQPWTTSRQQTHTRRLLSFVVPAELLLFAID
jgi:hypothetical protein